MQIPQESDIVIIGGGPAGSSAAALLRKKGYDVVVFEKAQHPREHVGESLIPHFWRYCDHIGVGDRIRAEGFLEKAGGTVIWNNRIQQVSFADFDYNEKALHVERGRFDQILFEYAQEVGAQTFERVKVKEVEFGDEWQTVMWQELEGDTQGSTRCRYVLDASGQASVLGRQLDSWEIDQDFRFVSLWGYFKDAKYVALDGRAYPFERAREIPPTTFVTALGDDNDSWSWIWHITLRETTSIGLVITRDELADAKQSHESLEQYYLDVTRTTPVLDKLLEGATYEGKFHAIRDFSYRVKEPAGPGYFMIGDAATFIDPIFSQGLVLAFYTANLAAWAVDRCLKRPEDAERNRGIYAQQFLMRADMARSMALPGYAPPEAAITSRDAVKFESKHEQRLMSVVAGLTNRSENFRAMAEVDDVSEDQNVRTLDCIHFAEE